MEIREYQTQAHKTSAVKRDSILHAIAGIPAEAGEIAAVLQKYHRGDYEWADFTQKLEKELGDLLWYAAELATVLGWNLDDIAQMNLDKLKQRASKGTIAGSGDDR